MTRRGSSSDGFESRRSVVCEADDRQLADLVPRGEDWLYEVKLDGYPAIAVKDGVRVQLFSRRGNDLANDYPTVARAVASIRANTGRRH